MENYESIKKRDLKIGDQEVSEYFGYKNRNSFNTSSKKPWIVNGIEKIIERFKSRFVVLTYDQAQAAKRALEFQEEEGFGKGKKEKEALAAITKQIPK